MKKTIFPLLSLLILLLASCHGQTSTDTHADTVWVQPTETDTVLSLHPISHTDTITIRGSLLTYTYHFGPTDSLPIVVNADGVRYRDNTATLTVSRGTTLLFRQTYTKQTFRHFIEPSDLRTSALVGFSYNLTKPDDHHTLHFIATVGDPDESAGVNYPVEINITADGSSTMNPAEDMETEPLIRGLNQDPSADAPV